MRHEPLETIQRARRGFSRQPPRKGVATPSHGSDDSYRRKGVASATGAAVRPTAFTSVHSVEAGPLTPSGRVSALVIGTNRGPLTLRGDEIRYALRPVGGTAILQSTQFRLAPVIGRDGTIRQLTLTGEGYGHGVGMCQWGAIGRARAGHDVRAILSAYYPGTTVAPAS